MRQREREARVMGGLRKKGGREDGADVVARSLGGVCGTLPGAGWFHRPHSVVSHLLFLYRPVARRRGRAGQGNRQITDDAPVATSFGVDRNGPRECKEIPPAEETHKKQGSCEGLVANRSRTGVFWDPFGIPANLLQVVKNTNQQWAGTLPIS